VLVEYDGWGNIESLMMDRNGPVGEAGSIDEYVLRYEYAKRATERNAIARIGATLPSGTDVTFNSEGLLDAGIGRISNICIGPVILSEYGYCGLADVVVKDYPQPQVRREFYSVGTGYSGLDRFNRAMEEKWIGYSGVETAFVHDCTSYSEEGYTRIVEDMINANGQGVSNFDQLIERDGLDRVVAVERGAIQDAQVVNLRDSIALFLDHSGNWTGKSTDVNGDGDFDDPEDLNEIRHHNAINEITEIDPDANPGTANIELEYDADGRLIDDGVAYRYRYDAFGRLSSVLTQDNLPLTNFVYNGLGFRIGALYDTNGDGVAWEPLGDIWFYFMYDQNWRLVAVYRGDDSWPKEEFVYHAYGLDDETGAGPNDVVCRLRDATTDYVNEPSDRVLEERVFFCQNRRGDVRAIVGADGVLVERVSYAMYGEPFAMPLGDADSDGDMDPDDQAIISNWESYDVRGDSDLDGDIDIWDWLKYKPKSLGRGILSGVGNRKGFNGSEHDASIGALVNMRNRDYSITLSRWLSRDPLEHKDGNSLYEYARSAPMRFVDYYGNQSSDTKCPAEAQTSDTHRFGFKMKDARGKTVTPGKGHNVYDMGSRAYTDGYVHYRLGFPSRRNKDGEWERNIPE